MGRYFNVCSRCGANLDPGEACSCNLVPETPKMSPQVTAPATAQKKKVAPKKRTAAVDKTKPRYTRGSRPERRVYNPELPCFW